MQQGSQRIALPSRIQGAVEYDVTSKRWRIWIHTNDFIYGTYLELHPDGSAFRVTSRVDEGDDYSATYRMGLIKPPVDTKEQDDGTT